MGTLHLVRHGQASFFEANYDRLSAAGEEQSRLLGACWAKRGVRIDRVFAGPLVRQQRSAELAGEAFVAGGGRWPAPVLVPELEEMRIEPLFREHLPDLFEKHEHLRGLGDALLAADGNEAKARVFAALFEAVAGLWIRGQVSATGVEAWTDFRARVRQALDVATQGRGVAVAAFSSGGVIAAAMQHALALDDAAALALAWRVRNSSVSTFVYDRAGGDRFSVCSFNELPHLDEARLVTLR